MDILRTIDVYVFYAVNHGTALGILDLIMPTVTSKYFGLSVLGAVGIYLVVRYGVNGLVVFVVAASAVVLSDSLGARILKPLIARPRPCVVLADVRLLVGMTTSYAMPSLHAANAFAFATAVYRYFPVAGAVLFPTAAAIAFSRVYVGVHWPGDVAAGALYGAVCAALFIFTEDRISRYLARRRGIDYVPRRLVRYR